MHWGPILSALRRNKVGAALIALQIAVTLAVLCNALFIITNRWVGESGDAAARERADLAALRAVPQIADATVSIDHPLGGPVMVEAILMHPDQPRSGVPSMIYLVDDHGPIRSA